MDEKVVVEHAIRSFNRDRWQKPGMHNTAWDAPMAERMRAIKLTPVIIDRATRRRYLTRARAELGKAGR